MALRKGRVFGESDYYLKVIDKCIGKCYYESSACNVSRKTGRVRFRIRFFLHEG